MKAIKLRVVVLGLCVGGTLAVDAASAQTSSSPTSSSAGASTSGGVSGSAGGSVAASPGSSSSTAPRIGVDVGPSAGTSLGGNNPGGVNVEEINKGNMSAPGGIATGSGTR